MDFLPLGDPSVCSPLQNESSSEGSVHDSMHAACSKRQRFMSNSVSPSSSSSSCFDPPSMKQENEPCLGCELKYLPSGCHGVATFSESADSSLKGYSLSHCADVDLHLQEEAGSCCEDEELGEVDIGCFLLHDCWEDTPGESQALGIFNPDTVFLSHGTLGAPPSTDCSVDDAAFVGFSAENGNWFLNDMEGEGHALLNEVLDQEWMAVAVANYDKINDTLEADLCVLHFLDADD